MRTSRLFGLEFVADNSIEELADIIESIDRGLGNAPGVKSITVTRKYVQPSAVEYQAIYIKVLDSAGKPIQGARVDVTWPASADVPNGAEPVAHLSRTYTMSDGRARSTAYIDLSDDATKTVTIKVTMRGRTFTATTTSPMTL